MVTVDELRVKLLQYRLKKDIKQIDLAKMLKVSSRTLSHIESGKTDKVTLKTLIKVNNYIDELEMEK